MTKEVPRTSVLRDAELSISDATLIARLRSVHTIADCDAAADRIELLEYMNNTLAGAVEQRDAAIEDLEAKLAKAVGGLKRVCRQPDYMFPSPHEIARTTLAELKGADHE